MVKDRLAAEAKRRGVTVWIEPRTGGKPPLVHMAEHGHLGCTFAYAPRTPGLRQPAPGSAVRLNCDGCIRMCQFNAELERSVREGGY